MTKSATSDAWLITYHMVNWDQMARFIDILPGMGVGLS